MQTQIGRKSKTTTMLTAWILILFYLTVSFAVEINRISEGGSKIDITDVPWVVRISLEGRTFCTGSIISATWVLSAAHCFSSGVKKDKVLIFYGSSKISSKELEKRVSSYKVHPDFDDGPRYDVAVVEVEGEFEFDETVQAIELDGTWPLTGTSRKSMNCIVAGWGLINADSDEATKQLRAIEVKGMHGKGACPCLHSYRNKWLVCVKGPSVCFGDSGGALVCDDKAVGITHAITTLTLRCKFWLNIVKDPTCNEQNSLNMFMFICPLLDWIHQYVHEVPETPASCLGVLFSSPMVTLVSVLTIAVLKTLLFYACLTTTTNNSATNNSILLYRVH